jgi:peptide-methionine (S)-S-oxide reductase
MYKTQYESAIFATTADQLATAKASKDEADRAAGGPLKVRIEPAGPFYRAEEYHQHYYGNLKGKGG